MTSPQSDDSLLLNTLMTSVLVLDAALTIRYVNSAAQQLLAQSARRLYGLPLADSVQFLSVDMTRLQHAVQNGQRFTDNEVTVIAERQVHRLALTAQPLADGAILLELTPLDGLHQFSEEQWQQTQFSMTRDLVRRLAHEIKNPLGGLRGAAQLLNQLLPDPSLQEYTTMIIRQADRLKTLVDGLLGPQRPGQRARQNLHQAVERALQLVALEKPEHIRLVRDYDPSLPEPEHDADQLEQALLNILRNAVQALGEQPGTITLRTRTAHQVTLQGASQRLAARIDILDNGPGIPAALQDTLFFPMVSSRPDGHGLGLAIARQLIDQHGGKISVASWPGHTCFSLYLPLPHA